jgi:hypothetical protein
MTLDELLKFRDEVTVALSNQADALRARLASLAGDAPRQAQSRREEEQARRPQARPEIPRQIGQHLVRARPPSRAA